MIAQALNMGYKTLTPGTKQYNSAAKKFTQEQLNEATLMIGGARFTRHYVAVKNDGSWCMEWKDEAHDQYGMLPTYTSEKSKFNQLSVYWMEEN